MGGFFGVVSSEDCVTDLFYGTDYHSHLGTKRGGMAITNSNGCIVRSIHDITNSQFRSKFDSELSHFEGRSGIGIISDYEDQPLIIGSHLGIFAIVTVGKINNIKELTEGDESNRIAHFFSEMSGGEFNPTEVVAALINTRKTVEEGIAYALGKIEGSCSLLLMINGIVYAARDNWGRTPVVIGRKTGAFAAAMETTALPNLDYVFTRELGPGEIVKLTPDEMIQIRKPLPHMQICAFFWVYFGYPSSDYEGTNTETVRYKNGGDGCCGLHLRHSRFGGRPCDRIRQRLSQTVYARTRQIHAHLAPQFHAADAGRPESGRKNEADSHRRTDPRTETPLLRRFHRPRHPVQKHRGATL